MKLNNKKIGAICGITALALVFGASFAYFTDRDSATAHGTAGTVDIELDDSEIVLTDADGKDILNPGDKRAVKFNLTNEGNKSIDVRTTIILKSSVAMTDKDGQAEYDLYLASNVEKDGNGGYKAKAGAKPIEARKFTANTITYKIADYVLDGDHGDPNHEIETEAADADSHTYDYVLVFRGDSENAFQGSTVNLTIVTEAKQHRNTTSGSEVSGWEVVEQSNYTIGDFNQDAVPEK